MFVVDVFEGHVSGRKTTRSIGESLLAVAVAVEMSAKSRYRRFGTWKDVSRRSKSAISSKSPINAFRGRGSRSSSHRGCVLTNERDGEPF